MTNIFRLKKKIIGNQKEKLSYAIRDHVSNELLVNKEDINNAIVHYVKNNLSKNKPKISNDIRDKYLIEKFNRKTGDSYEVTMEDFIKVLDNFRKKDTNTYQFLLKAGLKYKEAYFHLIKRIIDNEEIPSDFEVTLLQMIWKKSGPMNILKNQRFIHLKSVIYRTVDSINTEKMKADIIRGSSKFQIGSFPEHSFEEHVVTIKTILAKKEEENSGIIFLSMDIISFFDNENVLDCLETMEKIKINEKAIRLWYQMNKNTRVRVQTAFGTTKEEKVGDCVAQGTISAGLVSAANLDHGLETQFAKEKDVVLYENIRVQPLSYQDDIGDIVENTIMLRKHIKKLEDVFNMKKVGAHKDKSAAMSLGSFNFREKFEEENDNDPIYFNNFKLKIKDRIKYLGQIFKKDLKNSALETIKSREGRIKGATMEILSIIEDFTMQNLTGLMAAYELWERALVPVLLSGAGSWIGNIMETENLGNNIQDFYWRAILKVSISCPKITLQSETNMPDFKLRIWKMKILLLNRIKNLNENTLANEIWKESIEKDHPGLGKEVKVICQKLELPDINIYTVNKKTLKKKIEEAQIKHIKNEVTRYTKLNNYNAKDKMEISEYFQDKNIEDARLKFQIVTKMVKKNPGNFRNMYKFNQEALLCEFCPSELSQEHFISCNKRLELREGLDMENLSHLVIYFRKYIEHTE